MEKKNASLCISDTDVAKAYDHVWFGLVEADCETKGVPRCLVACGHICPPTRGVEHVAHTASLCQLSDWQLPDLLHSLCQNVIYQWHIRGTVFLSRLLCVLHSPHLRSVRTGIGLLRCGLGQNCLSSAAHTIGASGQDRDGREDSGVGQNESSHLIGCDPQARGSSLWERLGAVVWDWLACWVSFERRVRQLCVLHLRFGTTLPVIDSSFALLDRTVTDRTEGKTNSDCDRNFTTNERPKSARQRGCESGHRWKPQRTGTQKNDLSATETRQGRAWDFVFFFLIASWATSVGWFFLTRHVPHPSGRERELTLRHPGQDDALPEGPALVWCLGCFLWHLSTTPHVCKPSEKQSQYKSPSAPTSLVSNGVTRNWSRRTSL